jgi:hypothetical protein
MSILTTEGHPKRVALYNDTDDFAFGPVFETAEQAEDYLKFCGEWIERVWEQDGAGGPLHRYYRVAPSAPSRRPDPYQFTYDLHRHCHSDWCRLRGDPESGEIVLPDEAAA